MKTHEKYITNEEMDMNDFFKQARKQKSQNQDMVLGSLLQKIDNNIKELKANKKRFPEFAKAFDTLIRNFNTTKNDLMKDIQNARKKGVNIDIKA